MSLEREVASTRTLRAEGAHCGLGRDGKHYECGFAERANGGAWWCTQFGRELEFEFKGPDIGKLKRLRVCRVTYGEGEGR